MSQALDLARALWRWRPLSTLSLRTLVSGNGVASLRTNSQLDASPLAARKHQLQCRAVQLAPGLPGTIRASNSTLLTAFKTIIAL